MYIALWFQLNWGVGVGWGGVGYFHFFLQFQTKSFTAVADGNGLRLWVCGWESATTFSILTLSLKALSIMGLFATLSINNTQHKRHSAYQYWVPSCSVSSCWMSSCWVYHLKRYYAECFGASERDICNRRWYISSQTDRKRDRGRKMTGGRAIFSWSIGPR